MGVGMLYEIAASLFLLLAHEEAVVDGARHVYAFDRLTVICEQIV